jgi:hypothetical protein
MIFNCSPVFQELSSGDRSNTNYSAIACLINIGCDLETKSALPESKALFLPGSEKQTWISHQAVLSNMLSSLLSIPLR